MRERNMIAGGLLSIFVLYVGALILTTHVGLHNGVLVKHAHWLTAEQRQQGQHDHTGLELVLYEKWAHLDALAPLYVQVIKPIVAPVEWRLSLGDPLFSSQVYLGLWYRRGPPTL